MSGEACRTTFFTVADGRYELFVLPYAASVLAHNADARVEVCLHDADVFARRNADALGLLAESHGDRVLMRPFETAGVPPNSARFLETPKILTEYTYIGDIDILVLEAVSAIHIERMDALGLPYSNQVRTGRRALSGLHFTRSDAYYPVGSTDGFDPHGDEALLHALVTARGWATPPEGIERPGVHGYHMSPNRSPLSPQAGSRSTVAWGLGRSEAHLAAYRALSQSDLWRELFPLLDVRYRLLLGLLDLGLAWRFPGAGPRPSREVEGLLRNVDLVRGIVAMPDRRAGQGVREVLGDAASD